jgi:hypothetical protein
MGDEPMSVERFRTLADAYGADVGRWPPAEREAGRKLLAGGDPTCTSIIEEAAAIDDMLSAYHVPQPTRALSQQVIASAPVVAPPWSRTQLWWSGVGLATACLAGALAGAAIVAALPPVATPDSDYSWSYDQPTAFRYFQIGQEG